MPITPFHFGPGALLQSAAPAHVSFMAFCAANVLIDCESLYHLVHGHDRVHAFFHTYLGATLVIAATWLLYLACRWLALRLRLPNFYGWRALGTRQVLIGASLGAYSHVLMDSIMHSDIRPWWPWSDGNALLHVIALDWLHLACLCAGVLGLMISLTRWFVMGPR